MLKIAPGIQWVVERQGITLFSADAARCVSLPYPGAGLWALLANGNYTPAAARELFEVLLDADAAQASAAVAGLLAAWTSMGLLAES